MQITITDAIDQLRNDLRSAIIEGQDKEIIFTPQNVELELAVTFGTEIKAGGGFKLLTFLQLSAEGKTSDASSHKIKLTLGVADKEGNPIKVSSAKIPGGM